MLDIESLLSPIDEAEPSGPDLEYDAEWQEVERLSQPKAEQQFGDTIIPAEEPDWRTLAEKSEALFSRTKDIRNAILLARAQAHLDQFPGVASGIQLIHKMVEQFWDSVHPQLDAEDDNDPTMRVNALSAMADPESLLTDLRRTFLFRSRSHGELTIRQIEIVAGKLSAGEEESVPTEAQLDMQLAAVVADDANLPILVSDTLNSVRALSQLLDEKIGAGQSPDLKPLIDSLLTVDQSLGRVAGAAAGEGAVDEAGAEGGESGAVAGAAGPSAATGAIRSRSDVITLLDKISEYLQRTEPTNPVPLLLQRSKRLMSMNFVELMGDIAPDGLTQAQVVIGQQEDSSASSESSDYYASE